MKTQIQQPKAQETVQPKAEKQASIANILANKEAGNLTSNNVIQRWPFAKPLWVPGPGKGAIPFMGAQYDPTLRNPKHEDLLKSFPQDQCPATTFHKENDYASQYPMQGSKSVVGDAGIYAHRLYNYGRSFGK